MQHLSPRAASILSLILVTLLSLGGCDSTLVDGRDMAVLDASPLDSASAELANLDAPGADTLGADTLGADTLGTDVEQPDAEVLDVAVSDTASSPDSPSGSTANRLFASGFEGNITIGTPYSCGTSCWQPISGVDAVTGDSWPIDVWNPTLSAFQLLADTPVDASSVNNYIVNEIQTVTGPDGNPTQALYQSLLQQGGGALQNPYMLQPVSEQGDLYIRFRIKFQPDLAQRMGANGWRTFFEWKTAGDYRMIAYVYTGNNGQPYWFVKGDNVANGNLPPDDFWSEANHTVPVSQGQWITFEVFWHRSAGGDGRAWAAIDGQVIADRWGSNMGINSAAINRIMVFQIYGGGTLPVYQWIDDVEIWDGFPADATPH